MREIENLAEGQAFMDAADDILGLDHPFRDVEIARLRRAWLAGRDWAREQGAADEAVTAAAERLLADVASQRRLKDHEGEVVTRMADAELVARAALERNALRARVAELEAERERLRQISQLVEALLLADHLHTPDSLAWREAYARLCFVAVGNLLPRALGGTTAGVREAASKITRYSSCCHCDGTGRERNGDTCTNCNGTCCSYHYKAVDPSCSTCRIA